MKTKRLLAFITTVFMLIGIMPHVYAKEEYKNGDIIKFGSYPQTRVTDEKLIEKLNELPTEWKNYCYDNGEENYNVYKDKDGNYLYYEGNADRYIFYKPNGEVAFTKEKTGEYNEISAYVTEEVVDCGMKYTDVEFEGEKYRGVYYSIYRPTGTHVFNSSIMNNCFQYVNGYPAGTTYWFRYDDIEWIILDKNRGLLLSKDIIDSQPYCASEELHNYWEESSIREWLNGNFYDASFCPDERKVITENELKTVVYGYYGWSGYHSDDYVNIIPYHSVIYTKDKVFLPAISGLYKSDWSETIYTDVDDFPIPDISNRDEIGKIIGCDAYDLNARSVENCDDVLTLTYNNYYITEDGRYHNNYIIGNAMAKGSDYAKSQGLKVYKAPENRNEWDEWEAEHYGDLSQYDGYSYWFLRNTGEFGCAYKVTQFGDIMTREFTWNVNCTTAYGIRPALCIDFEKYTALNAETVYGDLDGDGEITAADARLTLRAAVGLEELPPEQKKAADVDGDGEITAADARLILRASVGLEDLTNRQK